MNNLAPQKVCVVIASYNGIDYIVDQIESLLTQTCPCTIFIFDDCSSDGTPELVKNRYEKSKSVFLIENEKRLGFVKNFEKGLKYVYDLGAYHIVLSDQDDKCDSERVSKIRAAISNLDEDEPAMAYSDLSMVDKNGELIHTSYLNFRGYSVGCGNRTLATVLGQNGVMGNTIIMNRSLVPLLLPFPETLHSHDYWISLQAHLYGVCVFVPDALVSYRIHSKNVSNSQSRLDSVGKKKHIKGLLSRDYRLPYKEDSRAQVLRKLLLESESNPDTFISRDDKRVIAGFIEYLDFDKSRWYLAGWMLLNGFIRQGFKHRVRFFFRTIFTKRYDY